MRRPTRVESSWLCLGLQACVVPGRNADQGPASNLDLNQRHKGRCFQDIMRMTESVCKNHQIYAARQSGHVCDAGSPPLFPRTCWKDVCVHLTGTLAILTGAQALLANLKNRRQAWL